MVRDGGRPIVVVGGGIVGTAIAYRLQIAKVPTVLVERDVVPQGASAFSFASLSAFDEPQRDFYLLKTHGMIAWRAWAKEFGDALGVRFPGELRWAESREAGTHLTNLVERALSRGYPVRYVKAGEVTSREPESRPRDISVATLASDDGQADPVRAIDVLSGAFADAGGELAMGRASLLATDDGMLVRIGDEAVEASTVVLATGAETTALLDKLGWDVPMDPSPGLLAVTRPVPPFLTGTVYVYPAAGVAVHLRQRNDGRVLIGERAQDEVAKHPTIDHARELLRQASKSFPALESTDVEHFTVEWRPCRATGCQSSGACRVFLRCTWQRVIVESLSHPPLRSSSPRSWWRA
jgi:hydrogen cyanide synthase HcnC